MNKKIVFIGHPISGDISGNIKKVLKICKTIHSNEIIPVAPYLISLRYLEDSNPNDRKLGIEANLECFQRMYIDELWLYGNKISNGMKQEIKLAKKMGISIVAKTSVTKNDLNLL